MIAGNDIFVIMAKDPFHDPSLNFLYPIVSNISNFGRTKTKSQAWSYPSTDSCAYLSGKCPIGTDIREERIRSQRNAETSYEGTGKDRKEDKQGFHTEEFSRNRPTDPPAS